MESARSEAIDQAPIDSNVDRMRELEELATLACEDNERLKGERDAVLRELDGARREIEDVRGEIARAHQELDGARREIEQLRAHVVSLQQAEAARTQRELASATLQVLVSAPEQAFASAPQQAFAGAPQQAFAGAPQQAFESVPQQTFASVPQQAFASAPQQAFVPAPAEPFATSTPFAPSPFADDASLDGDFGYPPKSGKGALYFFLVAIAGAVVAALCVMRPWDRPHPVPIAVEQPAPPRW